MKIEANKVVDIEKGEAYKTGTYYKGRFRCLVVVGFKPVGSDSIIWEFQHPKTPWWEMAK